MVKVRAAMSKKVFTIDEEESVREACKIMGEKHIGSLIVTSKGKPVGIFTERDLLSKVLSKGADLNRSKVKAYMSSPLTVVEPDINLREAARIMSQLKVRRLPVFESGRLVGILTSRDLTEALAEATLEF